MEATTSSISSNVPAEKPLILKKIKDFTATHHDSIERSALTKAIVDGTVTKEDYTKLLCKFYGFYKVCESALDSPLWKKANMDISLRKKIPLLEKDLSFLGCIIGEIAVCTDVPTLKHDAQKIGYLYVVEGSTLGGQFLSRAVEKSLGFTAEQGASYFNSYGTANLGYMWKQFQQLLTDFVHENPAAETEIMQSAAITFQKLDKWLA